MAYRKRQRRPRRRPGRITALADLLKPADRERLAARLRDLDELAELMRERGRLPAVPEPVPLHRRRNSRTKFSTTNLTKFSTTALVTDSTTMLSADRPSS